MNRQDQEDEQRRAEAYEAMEPRTFRVRWEIDIEATDEVGAAKAARAIMQDPTSSGSVFEVWPFGDCPPGAFIDLYDEDDDEPAYFGEGLRADPDDQP